MYYEVIYKLEFIPPKEMTYNNIFTLSTDWIVFSAKACSNAQIKLLSTIRSTGEDVNHIIVIIGRQNNRKTQLIETMANGTQVFTEVEVHNQVNCNEFRDFWIEWNTTHVTVGSGTLRIGVILVTELRQSKLLTAATFLSVDYGDVVYRVPKDNRMLSNLTHR